MTVFTCCSWMFPHFLLVRGGARRACFFSLKSNAQSCETRNSPEENTTTNTRLPLSVFYLLAWYHTTSFHSTAVSKFKYTLLLFIQLQSVSSSTSDVIFHSNQRINQINQRKWILTVLHSWGNLQTMVGYIHTTIAHKFMGLLLMHFMKRQLKGSILHSYYRRSLTHCYRKIIHNNIFIKSTCSLIRNSLYFQLTV